MFKDKERIKKVFGESNTWELIKMSNEIIDEVKADDALILKFAAKIYSIDKSEITQLHKLMMSPFISLELINRMQK